MTKKVFFIKISKTIKFLFAIWWLDCNWIHSYFSWCTHYNWDLYGIEKKNVRVLLIECLLISFSCIFRDSTDKSRRTSDQTDNSHRHRALRAVRSTGNMLGNNSGGGGGGGGSPEHSLLLIPGVKVRLYYLSKFTVDSVKNAATDLDNLSVGGSTASRPLLSKSASLNAFIQVESLSKETIVKPSLLDYLENAFEPIIMKRNEDTTTTSSIDNESIGGTGSMLSSSGSSLYSFPVDVVVLIRVQPSDIRFSCYPISKVECLLRIPSLDFAITSTPPKTVSSSGTSTATRKKSMKPRISTSSSHQSNSSAESGDVKSGMSFTVCLAKFSFCIFHPYGSSTSDPRSSMFSDRRKDSRSSRSQQMSGRKDSLSLNVEFIKFNLSRNTIKNIDDQKTAVQISGALLSIYLPTFSMFL